MKVKYPIDNKSMAVPQAAQECHLHDTSTIRAFSQRARMQRGTSTTAQPLPQRAGENSRLRSARREIRLARVKESSSIALSSCYNCRYEAASVYEISKGIHR